MQNVSVLGATGSIGCSTLDIVRQHPDKFNVVALSGNTQIELLLRQIDEFKPNYVVCADESRYGDLTTGLEAIDVSPEVLCGAQGLVAIASLPEVDMVMAAIVGAAGLWSTYAAVCAGKKVLLANKEALVMSGNLLMQAVAKHQAILLPVDSEHNAIFQCLPERGDSSLHDVGVERILLTGSGGPFLNTPLCALQDATPEQACAHPNWDMGRKISVDSASMMNKGLEYIEAFWLFGVEQARLQVVIHPQSVIHSMVQYTDGSILAQMGTSDMRIPIAHAMAYPERVVSGAEMLDFSSLAALEFLSPDWQRFPNLRLAMDAVSAGQWASTALNASNEIAVAAFLAGRIRFTDIAGLNTRVMDVVDQQNLQSIDDVAAYDEHCRRRAQQVLEEL